MHIKYLCNFFYFTYATSNISKNNFYIRNLFHKIELTDKSDFIAYPNLSNFKVHLCVYDSPKVTKFMKVRAMKES